MQTYSSAVELADAKKSENDAGFRAEAARSTGAAYLEKSLAEGRQMPSSIVVTAGMVAGPAA